MKRHTVRLPDGFNGDTVSCFTDPIETDGDMLKLQVAEPGRGHLFRWASRTDVNNALGKQARRNAIRRERDQAMRDLGLKRVRGSLGGVYWE
jgi:hypothetical protein